MISWLSSFVWEDVCVVCCAGFAVAGGWPGCVVVDETWMLVL